MRFKGLFDPEQHGPLLIKGLVKPFKSRTNLNFQG